MPVSDLQADSDGFPQPSPIILLCPSSFFRTAEWKSPFQQFPPTHQLILTNPYFYSSEKLTTDPQICQAKIAEPVVRTYANIAPGDILMKNGDVIAYEESLDLGSKKNDAIGIVFYNGTEVSSNGTSRLVALGIKYTEIGLKRPTNMENESWHPTEAPYSGLVVTCSGTAVTGNNANAKNGKNNYTTARQSATGYSKVQSAGAFYECSNYKNYDSNLAGTSYENDWYLPSVTELLKIKENNSYVNNSLSILENQK